jgi:iron complex outermembrane recepter protein
LAMNAVSVVDFPDRTLSAVSPRIGANVRVSDRVSIYSAYSRAFRAPTLNELYRNFRVGNVSTLANENLRAETADTIEGGVSTEAIRGKLSLRANIFSTSVSDPVVSITLATTPTLITRQRQNVGRTTARGIEVDAEFTPHDRWRINAGYLLSSSRVADFPADPTLVGRRTPQTARHNFTIQTAYIHGRLTIGAQGRGSSSQFDDDRNAFRLRPYFTLDASAAWRFSEKVSAFAAGENILNSRYDIGLTPIRTIAAPAFVRVGLRFKVGKR